MTAQPDNHQPRPPDQASASAPAPADWPDDADCLTPEQVAELAREEWELIAPGLDDLEYSEDPEARPPEWLPAEEGQRADEGCHPTLR